MFVYSAVIGVQAPSTVLRKHKTQQRIKKTKQKAHPKLRKQRTVGYAASEADSLSQIMNAPQPISSSGQLITGTGISADSAFPFSLHL